MEDFGAWLAARQYAPTTTRVYLIYARRLVAFTDPATATMKDLEEFLSVLPGTAPSKRAARKALVAFYRFLGHDPNPAESLPQIPEPQRLPRPLTEAEHLRWILAAKRLGGFHHLAGVMLASTGARQGEVRVAKWDDFSLGADPGTWRIRGKGARRRGPRWRQTPLHPQVRAMLAEWPRCGTHLFPDDTGGYWSDYLMRRHVLDIGREAGLGHVTAHRIRHSVATLVLAKTGDLRAVQTLLGHSSVQSTTIYTALADDRLAEVVGMLPF